jgi:phenol hydroxylase P5 protein
VSVLTLRVRSNRRATPTTRIVRIDLGDAEFPFAAGQWARLGPPDLDGQPFSIACSPRESRHGQMLEFLVRDEGSGRAIAALARGAALRVDGPHGRFHLPPVVKGDALFVAGGTGIAPLRSMLMTVLAWPGHPRCALLYSARSSQEFAYATELRRLARAGRVLLALTVTRAAAPRWRGSTGRVDRAQLGHVQPGEATQAFVCGPPGFVADVRSALEEMRVAEIRFEEQ